MKVNIIQLDRLKNPCKCIFETFRSGLKIKVRTKGCKIHQSEVGFEHFDKKYFDNNSTFIVGDGKHTVKELLK